MIPWDSIVYEERRSEARFHRGRITFDCFNLKVRGDRVFCSKSHLLSRAKDGTADLITILRGTCFGVCKKCKDYDGGD